MSKKNLLSGRDKELQEMQNNMKLQKPKTNRSIWTQTT